MKTYISLAILAVTLSACTLGANGEKDCEKRIPDIISEYSGKAESGFSIFYSQKNDMCLVNYTAPAEKE
jgi:hypothetical protein